jgi:predicted dehydrogenase
MAEQRQVRWGVIGAGGIADRRTIPALLRSEHSRLQAIVDVVNVEALASKYSVSRHGKEVSVVLDDDQVDAVYIATPVNLHEGQIRQAAEAGKHILCEKPLTASLESTRNSVEACREHGAKLQEGYMMRFHAAHQRIAEMITEGRLGRLTYLRAQLSCWFPPMPGAWRQDPAKGGGGALIDLASHLYDLLEMFAGPIHRVATLTGHQLHDYASEDSATTILEFSNGAQGTVDTFFNIPDPAVRNRLEVYGSGGAIIAEGTIGQDAGGTLSACFAGDGGAYDPMQQRDEVPQFESIAFEAVDPYLGEVNHLAQCILDDKPVTINGGDRAIHLAEVVDKAYESARTGRFLTINAQEADRA